jgi:hypothetical protein
VASAYTRLVDPEPHAQLGSLRALIGEWRGEGSGSWAGGSTFHYREAVRFTHNGKPFLRYEQRTEAVDDGRPLHAEAGYWRAAAGGAVERVVGHPTGVAEVETGSWAGDTLRMRSVGLLTAPSAKMVTALERDISVRGDVLRYVLRMATDGGGTVSHLEATLHRSA